MSKTALITGAARGIGRQIAIKLAEDGFDVIINFQGSEDAANETKRLCEDFNVKAHIFKADVSVEADCERLFEFIDENFETLDVVVNNAGVTRDTLAVRMSHDDFTKVIDTNLTGAFHIMKLAGKKMMKQKGVRQSIINISSVVAFHGNAGQINYSASKAGLIAMTKTLARELGSRGVTVNAVAPGFIETEMTEKLSDEVKKNALDQIALKRMGSTKDIANAVSFLASENASYITGQVLVVDGGMIM